MIEFLKQIRFFLSNVGRSKQLEAELQVEMDHHIELEIDRLRKEGVDPKEARRKAMLQFGSRLKHLEDCRAAWGVRFLDDCWNDVRFAMRQMMKRKLTSLVVVVVLSLCLAIHLTSQFILNHVIVHPYEFGNKDQIALVGMNYPHRNRKIVNFTSVPLFQFVEANNNVFSDHALVDPNEDRTLRHKALVRHIAVDYVTPSIWNVVGIDPLLGRFFTDERGSEKEVVISETLWKQLHYNYGVEPGDSLEIGKDLYQIVGVVPKSFHLGASRADVWMPWTFVSDQKKHSRRFHQSFMFHAKLKDGLSIKDANQGLQDLIIRWGQENPGDREFIQTSEASIAAIHIQDAIFQFAPQIRHAFIVLKWATLFIVIVGAVNIGAIYLTVTYRRMSEYAMRRVLGATDHRLMRQIVIEIFLYHLFAGLMCVIFLQGCLLSSDWILTNHIPWSPILEIDGFWAIRAIVFSCFIGFTIAVLPVRFVIRAGLSQIANQGRHVTHLSRSHKRLHCWFLGVQITLSTVFLLITWNAAMNLRGILSNDIGFEPKKRIGVELFSLNENNPLPQDSWQRATSLRNHLLREKEILNGTVTNKFPSDFRFLQISSFVPLLDSTDVSGGMSNAISLFVDEHYFETIGGSIVRVEEYWKRMLLIPSPWL